jgi:hypothetical protein
MIINDSLREHYAALGCTQSTFAPSHEQLGEMESETYTFLATEK